MTKLEENACNVLLARQCWLTKRAPDVWDSAAFGDASIAWHFSTPEGNPALEVLSTPAHPQVTQTVGRQNEIK